jgi:hypothetical protein
LTERFAQPKHPTMSHHPAPRPSVVAACLLALGALAGCTSSPYYDVRFVPAPLELQLATQASPQSQARALLSIRGIAKPTDVEPGRAELRLRIENLGTTTLTVLFDTFQLVSADLESFGPARTSPATVDPRVRPGATATYDVHFPLPAGRDVTRFDLSGLNLGWSVDFDGTRLTTGATFERVVWAPYDDSYPDVNVGFGVGYVHD